MLHSAYACVKTLMEIPFHLQIHLSQVKTVVEFIVELQSSLHCTCWNWNVSRSCGYFEMKSAWLMAHVMFSYCSADVDECVSSPCPQDSVCVNTRGSFSCDCALGYDLQDGRSCTQSRWLNFVPCRKQAEWALKSNIKLELAAFKSVKRQFSESVIRCSHDVMTMAFCYSAPQQRRS